MGTKLYKHAYEELIQEDIDVMEKYIPPEYNIIKGHIREILLESVKFYYPPRKKRWRLFRRWRPLF